MNIANPLVSVIIPVYNRELYIEECLNSILKQSYSNIEVIVINDCSSDKTSKILKKLSLIDSRLIIITNNKNMGATFSFNKGLKISQGNYVARMDSDDISFPQRIEEQVKVFKTWKNLDVLGTGAIIIDHNGNEIGKKIFPSSYKDLKSIIEYTVPVFDPSVMIKSELLKKNNGFNNLLAPADDFYLWLKLFKEGKIIANLNKYLIKYRLHESNLSKLRAKEQIKKSLLAIKIYQGKIDYEDILNNKKKLFTNFEEQFVNFFGCQNKKKLTNTEIVRFLEIYLSSINNMRIKFINIKILILLKDLLKKLRLYIFFILIYKFLLSKFLR